jgi:hypothetical protein
MPSGDDKARHDLESVTEISYPVLNRGEGLRVIASDGENRNDPNDHLLIGDCDRPVLRLDEERSIDRLEVPEKAGRSISEINGD